MGQVTQWFRGAQTTGNNSQPSQGVPITNIGGTAMTTSNSHPAAQGPVRGKNNGYQTGIGGATLNNLFVLFGVKGSRRTLELPQIDTKKYNDDRTFFAELRNQYKAYRGFWKYWFSVWGLSYCDFVKV
jgi:hypothetical protein